MNNLTAIFVGIPNNNLLKICRKLGQQAKIHFMDLSAIPLIDKIPIGIDKWYIGKPDWNSAYAKQLLLSSVIDGKVIYNVNSANDYDIKAAIDNARPLSDFFMLKIPGGEQELAACPCFDSKANSFLFSLINTTNTANVNTTDKLSNKGNHNNVNYSVRPVKQYEPKQSNQANQNAINIDQLIGKWRDLKTGWIISFSRDGTARWLNTKYTERWRQRPDGQIEIEDHTHKIIKVSITKLGQLELRPGFNDFSVSILIKAT